MIAEALDRMFGSSRRLADSDYVASIKTIMSQSWLASEVHTVALGEMLAAVSVVPTPGTTAIVVAARGDSEMLTKLRMVVVDGVLSVSSEVPFRPEASWRPTTSKNRSKNTQDQSLSVDDNHIIINDREVDLTRILDVVITVPQDTNVQVNDMVGAIGIGPS